MDNNIFKYDSIEDSYNTDCRYYVYNASDNVVSDPFQYQYDAIEFAIDNDYPVVKIHRYFYDDNGKINPDGDPEIVWSAANQIRNRRLTE